MFSLFSSVLTDLAKFFYLEYFLYTLKSQCSCLEVNRLCQEDSYIHTTVFYFHRRWKRKLPRIASFFLHMQITAFSSWTISVILQVTGHNTTAIGNKWHFPSFDCAFQPLILWVAVLFSKLGTKAKLESWGKLHEWCVRTFSKLKRSLMGLLNLFLFSKRWRLGFLF